MSIEVLYLPGQKLLHPPNKVLATPLRQYSGAYPRRDDEKANRLAWVDGYTARRYASQGQPISVVTQLDVA